MISIDYKEVLSRIETSRVLKKAFMYVLENNPGNFNPYHNLNHELQMCYHILCSGLKYYEEEEELMLAALFHDFGHSAGKESDEVNVRLAIEEFTKFCDISGVSYYKVGSESYNKVVSYIQATQYPYVISDHDLNPHQALIRDCDLLVMFSSDYLTQGIIGLGKEMNLGYKEAIEGVKKFTGSNIFTMRTDYGRRVMSENIGSFIRFIKVLESFYGEEEKE